VSDADRIRAYFDSAAWHGSAGRTYLVRERTRLLEKVSRLIRRAPNELTICDVGCGGGGDLVVWRDLGVPEAQLAGTELVPERASLAAAALPAASIRVVDGFRLPFDDRSFDVVTASLVVSTILSRERRQELVNEMARVTAPGGVVAVYDFAISKPWNRNVSAVTTRELTRVWRRPDEVHRAAPLLPALDIALRLPGRLQRLLIRVLPRTHRLWVWRVEPKSASGEAGS
jgi:ubiquinone/menaquinone biosynthesis C-methylase UbiE